MRLASVSGPMCMFVFVIRVTARRFPLLLRSKTKSRSLEDACALGMAILDRFRSEHCLYFWNLSSFCCKSWSFSSNSLKAFSAIPDTQCEFLAQLCICLQKVSIFSLCVLQLALEALCHLI